MSATQKISKFFNYEHPFSQYRYCEFQVQGKKFYSLIMFYEYMKAFKFDDKEAMEAIMKTAKGGEHRRIGKTIKGFNQDIWEKEDAEAYLKIGCQAKVQKNYLLYALYSYFVPCFSV